MPLAPEPEPVYGDLVEVEPPPRGCANRLLISFVLASFLFLCVAMIGLAGLAGYRDGVNDAATYAMNTKIADIGTQEAHIGQDQQAGRWESVLARCQYVATLRPGDQAMANCMSQAEQALSATPSPSITPTATATLNPPTDTPTVNPIGESDGTPTVTANPTEALLLDLWTRAQEAFRQNQYETARSYLEALQEADKTYDAHDVVDMLCNTYQALGNMYQNPAQLSQMIVTINKALDLNCPLRPSQGDWRFTIQVSELYLSAKGYLEAGNYSLADTVFKRFMSADPSGYLDGKTLACQAFSKAGDSAAIQTYCH